MLVYLFLLGTGDVSQTPRTNRANRISPSPIPRNRKPHKLILKLGDVLGKYWSKGLNVLIGLALYKPMLDQINSEYNNTSRNLQQCCVDDLILAPSPILQPTPFQSVQRQYTKPSNASLLSDSTTDHHSPHHYTSPHDSPTTPTTPQSLPLPLPLGLTPPLPLAPFLPTSHESSLFKGTL